MSSVDSSVYKLKIYNINLLIHERCVYKKLLEILGNCCVIVRHALHFHSHFVLFFFYLGFLSRTFTNHRTAGEGGGGAIL